MSFNLSRVIRPSKINMAAMASSRRMNMFNYPHTYTGVNSSLTNIPQKDIYPDIPRDAQVGDKAHYAHQNTRVFPEWYKPYGFNYSGDGWLAFFLAAFFFGGWSY